jgi:hypothetical protein
MIPRRMALLVTGITTAFAAVNVTVTSSRAGDDCLSGPNTAAPQGSHWYYRVDRLNHRECWYLGSERRTHAHQDASPARSHPPDTMGAQPVSQTPTEARTAEAVGAGPEPLTVAVAPVEDGTAKGMAAEPVPVEKPPGHDADVNGSGIEE